MFHAPDELRVPFHESQDAAWKWKVCEGDMRTERPQAYVLKVSEIVLGKWLVAWSFLWQLVVATSNCSA